MSGLVCVSVCVRVRAHAHACVATSIAPHCVCDAMRCGVARYGCQRHCAALGRGLRTSMSPDRLPRAQLASADTHTYTLATAQRGEGSSPGGEGRFSRVPASHKGTFFPISTWSCAHSLMGRTWTRASRRQRERAVGEFPTDKNCLVSQAVPRLAVVDSPATLSVVSLDSGPAAPKSPLPFPGPAFLPDLWENQFLLLSRAGIPGSWRVQASVPSNPMVHSHTYPPIHPQIPSLPPPAGL